MNLPFLILSLGFLIAASAVLAAADPSPDPSAGEMRFRPPSVPLVACDPYFSVWSPADRLTDADTVHWTGASQPLRSLLRIDGRTVRLLGLEPAGVDALPQTGIRIRPTRTIASFENDAIEATLTFLTPAFPDLDLISRPVTYVTWEVRSKDGKDHHIAAYFEADPDLVVNTPDQAVTWDRVTGDVAALRMGTQSQPVLEKKGDNLRIDWGYLYIAPISRQGARMAIGNSGDRLKAFMEGRVPAADTPVEARPASDAPSLTVEFDFGKVGGKTATRTLLLAYDDLYSIEYFHEKLRPYWRRNGDDADDLLRKSVREFRSISRRCRTFDDALESDLERSGGWKYARIGALAYRQAISGNKLAADSKGAPLLFPKENFSNGCIATVDIIYPMAPLFLLLSPALAKASIVPVLDYAASDRWKFPFAPHDLGTYPKANGQVYGGGERTEENQMPVEESGNMLLLVAALAKSERNADLAERYWTQLSTWADYLKSKGLDPESQLCTDDFAGHLAHNVNLSVKAIAALRAYAGLCEMRGLKEEAASYRDLTDGYVQLWMERANDGNHTRLAFDRPGTWSQKYNMVWDRILGMNLFPDEARRRETGCYRSVMNRYGLPLDSRRSYTKLDWILWTATLDGSRETFDALVDPVYDFLNDTPDRVPMTDWYDTKTARKSGFQARPVVGGVFLKLLYDTKVWDRWVRKGPNVNNDAWAALPKPPVFHTVVPTSEETGIEWRYTLEQPADGPGNLKWSAPGFDDSSWLRGQGGFGSRGTPGAVVRTTWRTKVIWLRREFEWPANVPADVRLRVHHDEDVEIYLNGVLAAEASGFTTDYQLLSIRPEARETLRPGVNRIAVQCRQTTGGQYIDAGFVSVETAKR